MKHWRKVCNLTIVLAVIPLCYSSELLAAPCIAPDNGSGTVNLPADCPYVAPLEPMYIIEGLPAGTTIELDPILDDYLNIVRTPGGSLGGVKGHIYPNIFYFYEVFLGFCGFNPQDGIQL